MVTLPIITYPDFGCLDFDNMALACFV